jgi:hypothetical protein
MRVVRASRRKHGLNNSSAHGMAAAHIAQKGKRTQLQLCMRGVGAHRSHRQGHGAGGERERGDGGVRCEVAQDEHALRLHVGICPACTHDSEHELHSPSAARLGQILVSVAQAPEQAQRVQLQLGVCIAVRPQNRQHRRHSASLARHTGVGVGLVAHHAVQCGAADALHIQPCSVRVH